MRQGVPTLCASKLKPYDRRRGPRPSFASHLVAGGFGIAPRHRTCPSEPARLGLGPLAGLVLGHPHGVVQRDSRSPDGAGLGSFGWTLCRRLAGKLGGLVCRSHTLQDASTFYYSDSTSPWASSESSSTGASTMRGRAKANRPTASPSVPGTRVMFRR
jgi:hypothetical protein